MGTPRRLLSVSVTIPAIPLALLLHPLHHLVDLALPFVLGVLARGRWLRLLSEFFLRLGALVNPAIGILRISAKSVLISCQTSSTLQFYHMTLSGTWCARKLLRPWCVEMDRAALRVTTPLASAKTGSYECRWVSC